MLRITTTTKMLHSARNLEVQLLIDQTRRCTVSPREDWLRSTLAMPSAVKSTMVAASNVSALRLKRPVE